MPRRKEDRRFVTISVTSEQHDRLRAYAEQKGLLTKGEPSPGLAAKELMLSALEGRNVLDLAMPAIEVLADRIEESVTRVSSRGTKAAIASLMMLCLQKDAAPAAALDELNADDLYRTVLGMAGLSLKQDQRKPELYKTVRPALQKLYKSDEGRDALLDRMEGLNSTRVVYALDEDDVAEWLKAMSLYRHTREPATARPRSMEERDIKARGLRRKARAILLRILSDMEIETVEDVWRFQDGMAYSRSQGWHEVDAREGVYRDTRVHGEYAGKDTMDPNWREA